jgi:hypothetical protein
MSVGFQNSSLGNQAMNLDFFETIYRNRWMDFTKSLDVPGAMEKTLTAFCITVRRMLLHSVQSCVQKRMDN